MNVKLAIFLLLASSLLFAEYYETIRVQVLDGMGRFLEGANVSIAYQLHEGKIVESTPKATDKFGGVNITIVNTETNLQKIIYDFTVYARFDNQIKSAKYSINKDRPNVIDMNLSVYYVTLHVVDQNKNPLPAVVSIGQTSEMTDGRGYVVARAAYGNKDIIARYKGVDTKLNIDIVADTARDITIPLYDLRVHVIDDQGSPLRAEVTFVNETISTAGAGYANFLKTPMAVGTVKVEYGTLEKEIPVSPVATPGYDVVFDMGGPTISEVNYTTGAAGITTVSAKISDDGPYASGFDPNTRGIYLSYKVNKTEREIDMYQSAFGRYVAEIPPQKPGNVVSFTIHAVDKDGNRKASSGSYYIPAEEEAGGTATPPGGSGAVPQFMGIDLTPLNIALIAIIAVVIIALVVLYLRKMAGD